MFPRVFLFLVGRLNVLLFLSRPTRVKLQDATAAPGSKSANTCVNLCTMISLITSTRMPLLARNTLDQNSRNPIPYTIPEDHPVLHFLQHCIKFSISTLSLGRTYTGRSIQTEAPSIHWGRDCTKLLSQRIYDLANRIALIPCAKQTDA